MGRRPNQLVLEFFERGQKLPDSSNRYEHTCKRCGEQFPKGRLDSLLSHLLRRCPNVTEQDREYAFYRMQPGEREAPIQSIQTSENYTRPNPEPEPEQENVAASVQHSMPSQRGISVPESPRVDEGPVDYSVPSTTMQDQQSALGMLAEVSRRHMDFRQNVHASQQVEVGAGQHLAEQALLLQQLQQARANAQTAGGLYQSHSASDQQSTPPQNKRRRVQPPPKGGEKIDFNALVGSPEASTQSQDVMQDIRQTHPQNVAEGRNLQLQPAQPIDPHLRAPLQPNFTSASEEQPRSAANDFMFWNPTTAGGQAIFGTLAAPSDQPGTPFGLMGKNFRKPQRGRFSDTRRHEVSKIRKQGACIRCRMLKKPCSESTPCNTCANVESARLWKGTCLRTKLWEEFTLFSQSLFAAKASMQTMNSVNGMKDTVLPGRLEVRLFTDSNPCMSFGLKQYFRSSDGDDLDPTLQAATGEKTPSIWLIDFRGDFEKIESYLSRAAPSCAEAESSRFFGATLRQAVQLMSAEQPNNDTQEPKASRQCYNLQESLLNSVVQLWLATSFLVAPDQSSHLEMRYNGSRTPTHHPEFVDWAVEESGSRLPEGPTRSLIRAQLLAAFECHCEKLAKNVINEIERRLLQRGQVSGFGTFISSVLLLSSVERITGFYHSHSSASAGTGAWPLATPPSELWPQGEQFADLLIMLLRMRALPPRTQERDGKVVVQRNYVYSGGGGNGNGKGIREQLEEQIEAAGEWLDPVGLAVKELEERAGNVEEWDLKLLSRVLMPSSMA